MVKRVSLLIIGLLVAVPLSAQVTAVQGPTKVRRFESPMILTMPFRLHPPARDTASRAFWGDSEDLSYLICDSVALYRVKWLVEEVKEGVVPVVFTVLMAGEEGHSKLVSLTFELLRSEAVVGTARIRKTYTIDKTLQPHGAVNLGGQYPNIRMPVNEADFGGGTALTLRVTVEIGDWTRWGAPL